MASARSASDDMEHTTSHLIDEARGHEQRGHTIQAELLYRRVLNHSPGHAFASTRLAQFAINRGDLAAGIRLVKDAIRANPSNTELRINLAVIHVTADAPQQAIATLQSSLAQSPDQPAAWLMLGQLHDAAGAHAAGLRAAFEGVTRARQRGQWLDEQSTPPQLLDAVLSATARIRDERRELFLRSYDEVRETFGATALHRVDHAVKTYLREADSKPTHPAQRPRFLYFPGLPDQPYHDPYLQPWARRLKESFAGIRQEAIRVLTEDSQLPAFVNVKDGDKMENYVGGNGLNPSWEAFFFYRRGMRFDANHARCPETSAVLDAIDLCRINDQAPEICFSILRAGTVILPHYGVTNTRLVMHLPLVVPGDCALNVTGGGEHHWAEGELVMFDDTFEHDAWNKSSDTRVVLLMDCWNPHLSAAERLAVKQLIETITALQLADKQVQGRA